HVAISSFWSAVLWVALPRRRTIAAGAVAGVAIAALDLGFIGRRLPAIRWLAIAPQVADHLAFGMVVGWGRAHAQTMWPRAGAAGERAARRWWRAARGGCTQLRRSVQGAPEARDGVARAVPRGCPDARSGTARSRAYTCGARVGSGRSGFCDMRS